MERLAIDGRKKEKAMKGWVRMNIKLSGLLWLTGLSVLMGVACAPQAAEQGPGGVMATPAPTTGAPAQPKSGGLMTIAISEGPKTMDPHFSTGVAMNHPGRPIFQNLVEVLQPEPLTDSRQSGKVEPQLAESWSMPDDKTIIFKLRKGVKFHNGGDMTADDVVYSLERIRDPNNKFSGSSQLRSVDKIVKTDDYTVTVTLKDLNPDILRNFSNGLYILSKKLLESGADPKKEAVGTGPFRQVKFQEGAESVSVKFADYWDKGKPYLDGLRHIIGLDRSAILAAFATKKLDFYNVTDKVQFDQYKAQVPDLKNYVFYSDYNYGWLPNTSKGPLKDLKVRKAMQLAIDRHAINDAVAFGIGLISAPGDAGFLGKFGLSQEDLFKMPGWRKDKTEDIAEAKRLMKEAGFPNGFKLRALYISTFTTVPQIAELMANQLKSALNIELELIGLDTALWTDAVDKKGDYDLAMGNTRITSNPDINLTNYWYSKGAYNHGAITDPKLDDLIIRQKTIMNDDERRKAWTDISKIITENVYYIPSLDAAYFGITQAWVNNLYGNFAAQPWLRKPAEVWFDVSKMPADRVKADNEILAKYK